MLSLWVEWGKCDPSGSFLAPQTLRLCLKCVSHCFRFLLTSLIAEEGVLRGRRRGKGVGKGGGRRGEGRKSMGRGKGREQGIEVKDWRTNVLEREASKAQT